MVLDSEVHAAEAALAGHPDKMADAIGDAILDAILTSDPFGRAGIQVMVSGLTALIGGQVRTRAEVDVVRIARQTIADIGYRDPAWGFQPDEVEILDRLDRQTDELASNVERGGAGDSACVYGHACRETDELVPMAYRVAQGLAVEVEAARRSGALQGIGPDGKIQVAIEFVDGKPQRVDSVVLSLQNRGARELQSALEYCREVVVPRAAPEGFVDRSTVFEYRAGVGFTVGGPRADTGLSSRKVIADAYGAGVPWGGGGLSGKDPSKIDRCGSYLARHLAKSVVAAGLADVCGVMLGYAIGQAQPLSVDVTIGGPTTRRLAARLSAHLRQRDLSTRATIDMFELRRPIYQRLSFGGHFGRNAAGLGWERVGELARELVEVNHDAP